MKAAGQNQQEKTTTLSTRREEQKNKALKQYDRKGSVVPYDIVRKIFANLPCKSLVRLKTASKQLYSLTDDQCFVREYWQRTANNPCKLIFWDRPPRNSRCKFRTCCMYNLGPEGLSCSKQTRIVQACYQVSLLSCYGLVCLHGYRNQRFAVYNPTSREMITLPDMPAPYDSVEFTKGLNELGFGFHPESNSYKVIQLVRDSAGGISTCHVLTVTRAESSWRRITDTPPAGPFELLQYPVCVDGVLYFETVTPNPKGFAQIIDFDLGTEKFELILSPAKLISEGMFGKMRHLVALQGKLCYNELSFNNGSLQMEIWTLGSSKIGNARDWRHLHRLELDTRNSWCYFPICSIGDNKILLKDLRGKLHSYDLKDNTMKIYGGQQDIPKWSVRLISVAYAETFVNLR